MTTHPFSSTPARAFRLILVAFVLLLAAAAFAATTAHAAGIVVNDAGDTTGACATTGTGTCTLRDAITYANSTAGADTITFSISNATILLSATLPTIGEDLTIDGTGQNITISGQNNVRIMSTAFSALTLNVTALRFDSGNTPSFDGAAIEANANANLNVTGCTFDANVADSAGGAIYAVGAGTLTVTESTFGNNYAGGSNGGAIWSSKETTNITNSTFTDNRALRAGGAIYSLATLNVSNSTFSGNHTTDSTGGGGAIDNDGGTANVDNSTFSGNYTAGSFGGGAIYNFAFGTLNVTSSTLSGNYTSGAGTGGGIYDADATNGPMTLKNTIIADSTGGGDCVGTAKTPDSINNLIEDSTHACGLTNGSNGNIVGTDPNLGALANNGGPTETHALLPGSPAIDAGDTTLTTDQRGQLRPQGAADDIGAFETSASLRFTIEAPTVQTSQVSCPAPGVSLQEDFDSLSGSGVNQVTGGALGDYVASGSFLTVFGQDAFGGAEQPNNPTKKYLELETSGGTGWYTLDLTATGGPGPVGYFGFWWSAGDGNNVLEVTRVDGSVETFTTQSIINSPALQGSPGCPDAGTATCHFGNPTAAFQGQNAAEAYSFVNIYAQDEASKIVSVRFETTGSGFESDNHTICTEVIDPNNQGGADLGGIVIKKVTNPVGGTGFGFTQTIDGNGPFTLDDGDEQPFTSVQPGSYTVAEDAPTGSYVLTDITCVDGDTGGTASTWDVALRTATINVDLNETVTCTFYNVDPNLAVTLASFDAAAQAGHVLVTWETVSELGNAGFNLYRTQSAGAPTAADLLANVPSQGPGSTQGFAYSYPDYAVTAGQAYWYWLEDVDLNGATTLHGPVSVVFSAPTAVTLSRLEAAANQPAVVAWPWLLALLAAALAAVLAIGRRSSNSAS